jgi:radical SAM protein with 4Fe4S-binding SPASM domain
MDDDTFNKILSQLKELPVKYVMLSLMGEPLLDSHIVDKIAKISSLGYRTRITTNASMLTKELGAKLLSSGLSEIFVSFNGGKKQTHNEMMNFPMPMYEVCRQNLIDFSILNNGRILMHLNCLVDDKESFNNYEFSEYWQSHGFLVDISSPAAWHKALKSNGRDFYYPCQLLFSQIFIDCDGNAIACCRDYKSRIQFGNVNNEDLYSIWHGKKISEFRKSHLKGYAAKTGICTECELAKNFNLF